MIMNGWVKRIRCYHICDVKGNNVVEKMVDLGSVMGGGYW